MIFGLCSMILFMITECTKTDPANEDATLTSEPTVAEATAEELLNEIETCSAIVFSLYNFPSYYYDYLLLKLDAFTEFLDREDYATVTLSSYKKADFYENNRQDQSYEVWQSYKAAAIQRDNAIAFDEILLANEDTFDILSDEEKIDVLNEVKEKLEFRTGGHFTTYNSPFLIYVQEQNRDGKSKWYDYIMDSGEEYSKLKEFLSEEILNWGGFNY
jgi:hypothetical protein